MNLEFRSDVRLSFFLLFLLLNEPTSGGIHPNNWLPSNDGGRTIYQTTSPRLNLLLKHNTRGQYNASESVADHVPRYHSRVRNIVAGGHPQDPTFSRQVIKLCDWCAMPGSFLFVCLWACSGKNEMPFTSIVVVVMDEIPRRIRHPSSHQHRCLGLSGFIICRTSTTTSQMALLRHRGYSLHMCRTNLGQAENRSVYDAYLVRHGPHLHAQLYHSTPTAQRAMKRKIHGDDSAGSGAGTGREQGGR